MLQKAIILICTLVIGVALHFQVSAQVKIDHLDLEGNVYQWYDNALGKDKSGLLLGEYQEETRMSKTEHQFYLSDQWKLGRLIYRNQLYDSVLMILDIEKDLLLIKHPTKFTYHDKPIKLEQHQVQWFEMQGHRFVYISADIPIYAPGFFDELYAGNQLCFYAKRVKYQDAGTSLKYENEHKYFFNYNDQYFRYLGKNSLLQVLKPYKVEIKKYLRDNQIQMRAKEINEGNLARVFQFCNQLLEESAR